MVCPEETMMDGGRGDSGVVGVIHSGGVRSCQVRTSRLKVRY
jgi:hypothetical protein